MKKILIVSALATACLAVMAKNDEKSLIQYVDVTVGTGERFDSSNGNTDSIDPRTGKKIVRADKGQTLPAVLEPNGMNFWTPETESTERKGASPYYYSRE